MFEEFFESVFVQDWDAEFLGFRELRPGGFTRNHNARLLGDRPRSFAAACEDRFFRLVSGEVLKGSGHNNREAFEDRRDLFVSLVGIS